ncbi:hypothetical protein LLEC1_03209 [Akanthomyces lecanii]|uniref:LrgB-like protein n=1 Tax=Cordyceps confragosa TaxID=2714763 RepID=A0A179IJC0_CORDF|nr:hypothetical protein LLEC1_03209 [Akanthomyces lecanii]
MEDNRKVLLKDRRQKMWQGVGGILSIAVIYLTSELLIWGLSRALAPATLEFFSSIFGMLLVFVFMMLASAVIPNLDGFYEKQIRSKVGDIHSSRLAGSNIIKVDFINRHMGAAFAIPMVMLGGNYTISTKTIGLVVGVFGTSSFLPLSTSNADLLVATSLVAWTTTFMLARLAHFVITRLISLLPRSATSGNATHVAQQNESQSAVVFHSSGHFDSNKASETAPLHQPRIWNWLSQFWSLIASFIAMFAVGVPLAVVLGEPRILDGSALWFVWMASITLQRVMKQQVKSCIKPPKILPILTTLANPVLITILLMTAYARAKAYAMSTSISDVLEKLSSGTQLYTIWTSGSEQSPTVQNQWFGAGDAALSMLGCGFIVWGFKLYECRRQLFSAAGLVTILVSISAAAGNVFLGTHAAFLMGLERPEALAFAARMTTLALAIPAMKNVGGNTSLTVALMITNGILGQLAYPSSLNGVDAGPNHLKRKPSTDSCDSTETAVSNATASQTPEEPADSANTVAAGIAIGINGAAMGVAYLYENKSRSAPYAALAVTTYGVATVVFIAVHPFKDTLLSLV